MRRCGAHARKAAGGVSRWLRSASLRFTDANTARARMRTAASAVALACLIAGGVFGARPAHGAPEPEGFPVALRSVAGVQFTGVEHVSKKDLRAALKTRKPSALPWREKPPLRLDFLRADTSTIAAVYRQNGYIYAHARWRLLPGRDERYAIVQFDVIEGERTRIATVDLNGVNSYPEDQLRKKLLSQPGRPFNPQYLVVDTARVSAAYQQRGYLPHVTGEAVLDSLAANVTYDVHEGPLYRFDTVYLSSPGTLKVKESAIRRELMIKKGDIYRSDRIERSIERLYETGLFSQVQMTSLPDSANAAINVDLRVRERKPRYVDTGIGSGTTERLRVTADAGHRNLTARGLAFSVGGLYALDADARFYRWRTQTSLMEPWLFGTRTRGAITGSIEERDERSDPRWVIEQHTNGISFSVRRELNRFTTLGLVQDNLYVEQDLKVLDRTISPATRDSIEAETPSHYTTHKAQLYLDRDLRDNPIITTRGSEQIVTGEVAGGPLKGTSSFFKYGFQSRWFTPNRKGWVLGARVQAGVINPFGEPPFGDSTGFTPGTVDDEVARVPDEERFRTGGVNSIRGYDESSIPPTGGLALILANIELRVPIKGPLGVELYVDCGNVWARPDQVTLDDFRIFRSHESLDPDDVRLVFGFGPRLNLPIGPLRFDLTWSLRPTPGGSALVAERQFAIGPSF